MTQRKPARSQETQSQETRPRETQSRTSLTVNLQYPVVFDGREITSLTFRRMKAKDALVAEGETSEARAGYALFAALAGVDVEVIEELDVADMEAIGEAIVPLMGKTVAGALRDARAHPFSGGTS